MNLDELRSVRSTERQTDSLQHLRESFYADVADYVAELEAERDRRAEEVDDPFADPEVRRLADEVETAREVVEAIYERRLGKLLKRASLAAADMPADEEGLTEEERALFEDLVDRIEGNKARVLEVVDGGAGGRDDRDAVAAEEARAVTSTGQDAPAGEPAAGSPGSVGNDRTAEAAGATPGDSGAPDADTPAEHGSVADDGADRHEERSPEPDGGGAGADARTTVRVTGDVDRFFGVDEREYDLDPEDVVALPAANAEPLLRAGDAERLD